MLYHSQVEHSRKKQYCYIHKHNRIRTKARSSPNSFFSGTGVGGGRRESYLLFPIKHGSKSCSKESVMTNNVKLNNISFCLRERAVRL